MARLRSAPATQRSPLKERTNIARGARKAPAYENDGNTEGLVKERKGRSKTVAKAQNEDELVMAGGLGVASDAPPTTDELARSEGTLMTVKMPRRAVKRGAQSNTLDEAMQIGRSSGLPLEASPPSSRKLNSVGKRTFLAQPGSAIQSHGTPAVETSVLALRNFKRRPRQPSMLAMVQQRTGVVSARPSLAPTAVNDDLSVYDFALADSDDDGDVFAPEAEGTPVQAGKSVQKPTRKQTPRAAATEKDAFSRPRKRKSDEANLPASSMSSSDAKRPRPSAARSLLNDEALPNHLTTRRSSSDRQTTPPPQVTSDVQVANSSPSHPSSTPPTERSSTDKRPSDVIDDEIVAVPSTKDQQQQDKVRAEDDSAYDAPDGTMAEPASSSPVPQSPTRARQISSKSVEPATQADPLTQISPSSKKRPTDKKSKPISTATLQSLLPKRRRAPKPRHRKSEYDFDAESDSGSVLGTSHPEADEDELAGRQKRQVKQAATSTKSRKTAAAKTTKAKAGKAAQQRNRNSATEIVTQTTKKPTRTYGRQAIATTVSDKENEMYESVDDENDTTELPTADTSHEGKTSAALQAAKDKFAEIDQWDMEFESLGDEDHRSSSQGWR
ncbi:hypothetical protein EJ03DRAFT_370375 [Teratosphaeria nubilosa]|uniref:Uncharacterized protein n=1 Tax=Teratosphaeria nubilosa TaxID=161662 RepID=A0A6G1LQ39_9PEZI|nr:hypothetical protein EJ03DRAFT_370375 [Teratosphaeria nubilosa]